MGDGLFKTGHTNVMRVDKSYERTPKTYVTRCFSVMRSAMGRTVCVFRSYYIEELGRGAHGTSCVPRSSRLWNDHYLQSTNTIKKSKRINDMQTNEC